MTGTATLLVGISPFKSLNKVTISVTFNGGKPPPEIYEINKCHVKSTSCTNQSISCNGWNSSCVMTFSKTEKGIILRKGKTRVIWRRKTTGPAIQDSRVAEEMSSTSWAPAVRKSTKSAHLRQKISAFRFRLDLAAHLGNADHALRFRICRKRFGLRT